MRLILIISLNFITISLLFAQVIETTTVKPESSKDSLRAYYIQNFPNYFFVYPVIKQRSLNFELEKRGDIGGHITYKPNNSYSSGIGLYVFELALELAFAVPLDEKSIERYGKSKARDIQLNLLSKRWGVDVFYQKYKGF